MRLGDARTWASTGRRRSAPILAVLPGLAVALVLVALVAVDPRLAGRLMRENGPVEWLQVVLAAAALGIAVWSLTRRFSSAGLLGIVALSELIAVEIDLDRRLFGIFVIDWKFFRRTTVSLPVRTLVAIAIVTAVTAFFVYAVLRWRQIWSEARAGFRAGWAWLLLAGLVLYGIPQPCERYLNRLFPLPPSFLEESLELLGTLYVFLGTAARSRHF